MQRFTDEQVERILDNEEAMTLIASGVETPPEMRDILKRIENGELSSEQAKEEVLAVTTKRNLMKNGLRNANTDEQIERVLDNEEAMTFIASGVRLSAEDREMGRKILKGEMSGREAVEMIKASLNKD